MLIVDQGAVLIKKSPSKGEEEKVAPLITDYNLTRLRTISEEVYKSHSNFDQNKMLLIP